MLSNRFFQPRSTRSISFRHSPRIRSAASVNLGANFAQGIDTLTEQVRFLQDQEALEKLPSDPRGFIEYARQRATQMGGDPDAAVWNDLVKRAQFKVDELDWQQGIHDGTKSLEDFHNYLQDRYNNAVPGSVEAQQALYDIDNVKKAISARNSNSADQSALYSYLQSNDFNTYIKYLQGKLARAGGQPQVQQILMKQIAEMQARADKAGQTERTQTRATAVSDYLQGRITATEAVTRLQRLMQSPGITPGEVSAIGTEIGQILQHARGSSANSAARGLTDQMRQSEKDYTDAKAAIQYKIDHQQEVTQEDWARVNTAGQLVGQAYGDVADYYANRGDAAAVKVWTDRQNGVQGDIRNLSYSVDKSVIGDVNTSTPTFLAGIKNLPPDQQVQAIALKVAKLNQAAASMRTDQGRGDVQKAIVDLKGKADDIIAGTRNKDLTSTTQAQKDALDHEFRNYVTRYNNGNATTDKILTQDDYTRELRYTNNAKEFSDVSGITFSDADYQRLKGLVVPQDNREENAKRLQDLYDWGSQPVSSGPLPYLARKYQSPDAADRNLSYGGMLPADELGTTGAQNTDQTDQAKQGRKGLQSILPSDREATMAAPEARSTMTPSGDTLTAGDTGAQDQGALSQPTDVSPDGMTLNDYLDGAMRWLNETTRIDIPDIQVLDLPSDTSFGGGSAIGSGDSGNVNYTT